MGFPLSINVALGKSRTGLTLKAQLVDKQGVHVGAPITTGFTEIGDGQYLWYYDAFPTGFTGGVKFLDANTNAFHTFIALNDDDLLAGAVLVDHNYGGADVLAYETAGGVGISGATIRVYLTSDYDAGNTGKEFIVASTVTTNLGHWSRPIPLDPDDYTLIYFKQGAYGPDRKDITVAVEV